MEAFPPGAWEFLRPNVSTWADDLSKAQASEGVKIAVNRIMVLARRITQTQIILRTQGGDFDDDDDDNDEDDFNNDPDPSHSQPPPPSRRQPSNTNLMPPPPVPKPKAKSSGIAENLPPVSPERSLAVACLAT